MRTLAESNLFDNLQKSAQIAAIIVAGAWVYFKTIRGRTFIPRLQPRVTGKVSRQRGIQYLVVDFQVQNVGSSIAFVKEGGSALVVRPMQAFATTEIAVPNAAKPRAFPIFDLQKEQEIAVEPGQIIYSQEMIEVPVGQYDAFRIELRVSAVGGNWFSPGGRKWGARKWRAWTVVPEEGGIDSGKQQSEAK